MDEYRDAVRKIGAAPIGAIISDFASTDGPARYADNQYVTVAGVVSSTKTRTTRNNSLMSYITLEDDTGSMELIAFQKALDSGGGYVRDNAALIIRGRISVRDEKEPQIMVDSIRPLSDIGTLAQPAREQRSTPILQPAANQKLWVKLPGAGDARLHKIELILTMFPGTQQMIIWCEREKKRIGASCLIHPALVQELKELLGDENVVIK